MFLLTLNELLTYQKHVMLLQCESELRNRICEKLSEW